MCGILGTIPPSDPMKFAKALDTLAHRGPDSQGVFHNQYISLGHTRLSIIDLSHDASQPMNFPINSQEKQESVCSILNSSYCIPVIQGKNTGGGV